jgi:hypothetical protein
MPRKIWPKEDRAYNGDQLPMRRQLSPRERDVLVRVLGFVIKDPRYVNEELQTLEDIRRAVNPRPDDTIELHDIIQHDVMAGLPWLE